MREFNALGAYPHPKERFVGSDIRTIKYKISRGREGVKWLKAVIIH